MPSADKRARKKENARAAREEREAALRRKKRLRSSVTVGVVVAIFVGVIVLLNVAGGGKSKKKTTATGPTTTLPNHLPAGCVTTVPKQTTKPRYTQSPPFTLTDTVDYFAHVVTSCGSFDMNLHSTDAPKAVNSFIFLARNHFYDGLKFWRVAKDFVIQGGDPLNNGNGDAGYQLPTEPPPGGYHVGSVGMANGGPNSTSSQFFVVLTTAGAKQLGGPPYPFTDIGDIIKGSDVIQKLGSMYSANADPNDKSTQVARIPIYIFKVTISTQKR